MSVNSQTEQAFGGGGQFLTWNRFVGGGGASTGHGAAATAKQD